MRTNKQLDFLVTEFMYFSIQAGFATRNEDFPIYNQQSSVFNLKSSKLLRRDIKEYLLSYYSDLLIKQATEEEHKKRLLAVTNEISKKHGSILHKGKFRLGVTQKIINLFLKYLWVADLISEPHHCPFDNIVKLKIQKHTKNQYLVDWTEMKSMREYEAYLKAAKIASMDHNNSIAQWELSSWKSR